MQNNEYTDSDTEITEGRGLPFVAQPCRGAACSEASGIRWNHPDGEGLYQAILASPTTSDVLTIMSPDASVHVGFFEGARSHLRIPRGQTIGIVLKMHSSLSTTVLATPFGISFNKNNTSPCGTGTNLAIHNSEITPVIPSRQIATELEHGFAHCYTLQHYVEEILVDPKYVFDRRRKKLMFVGDGEMMPGDVDLREFNGACRTIMNITHLLSKSYETRPRDPSFVPECFLSFNGITIDLLQANGLQTFLQTFQFIIDDLIQMHILADVFEQIQRGTISSSHLITLIELFRDVFGAVAVNIFDSGCTPIFDPTQGRYLTPAEGHDKMLQLKYSGVFFDGYGGKRKTKQKKMKRKKKQTKKLKILNRPH
jgi:hypothetical protein